MKKIALCCCLLALPFLSGCGHKIEPGTTPEHRALVKGLSFQQVQLTLLPGSDTFVGTVESPDRGVIAARIDGQVSRVLVKTGDRVQAGQLLLILGDNVAADRLREAEAGLAQAQQAEAMAQAHLVLAQKTYARYKQLFQEQAATPQEMDQMTAQLAVAQKGLNAAQAGVARATSARNAARVALSYTRVTSPFAGRVVHKKVQVGSTVMPGSPLLVIDRHGPWQVRADVPESFAGRITLGEALSVTIPSIGRTLTGPVTEIQPAADPQSRSFQIKVNLPPAKDLVAGLYARVAYNGRGAKGILIPRQAIVTRGQLNGVFIRKDGILHLRLVQLGREVGERVEILSGLRPGETVVTAGARRAVNGGRVED